MDLLLLEWLLKWNTFASLGLWVKEKVDISHNGNANWRGFSCPACSTHHRPFSHPFFLCGFWYWQLCKALQTLYNKLYKKLNHKTIPKNYLIHLKKSNKHKEIHTESKVNWKYPYWLSTLWHWFYYLIGGYLWLTICELMGRQAWERFSKSEF